MRFAKVPRSCGQEARKQLMRLDAVDRDVRIVDDGDHVLIPLRDSAESSEVRSLGCEVVEGAGERRIVYRSPLTEVRARLGLPRQLERLLPSKWELLGDVLVLRLPPELEVEKERIASAYAYVLRARTVCQELGAIEGTYRTPQMRVIYGQGTETVHRENRILYKLDVAKVMFSSGNKEEKQRMAKLDCRGETVVDMFAGIGYFTLPVAKHAKASRVIACEINPIAHHYLMENIALNHVHDIVVPYLGDNRSLPGQGFADRIIMGYVGTTHEFLPKALSLVRPGGIIHYHETCPVDLFPQRTMANIRSAAGERGIEVLRLGEVKSFAPAISHYVIDFRAL